MKVALVHDYLVDFGGAERVLIALSELYPTAPIYTLLYDKEHMQQHFPHANIIPSYLNILPRFIIRHYRRFLILFLSRAARSFDLSEYDLIISSASGFAKGCIKASHAKHICYCHSPTRFLWDYEKQYQVDNHFGFFKKFFFRLFINRLKNEDLKAVEGVDVWIANSRTTQKRIEKYYHKKSTVIYPPATVSLKKIVMPIKAQDYFLVVARISAYKKVDLIVKAFNICKKPLLIIGNDSAEQKQLEKIAHDNITFITSFMSDDMLARYYAQCKAFILANEEDLGLAAVEAASFGRPVLAYKKGGATEWMQEGKTGEFFEEQTVKSLLEGIKKIESNIDLYRADYITQIVNKFSKDKFKENIQLHVKLGSRTPM